MSELSRYQDTLIGPYRLARLIGVGPVSRVYVSERQDWPEHQVALKLFESVPLHELEEKDQALDEVRLLACMEHPALLPILDDGLHEDMLYLVTPYLKEGSLRQRLTATAGNPLPMPEALALTRQIGEALQFAHSQQIVHANLKPENILFQSDGRVLLADFLLSGLVKSERAARILSTFAALYMAPEQFRGMATPLSDQYALACLTYELLTGKPPFEADDGMSLARQHATREPVPPSQLQPLCEPQIDHALLKALVKRPEGRYPDIQTFLAELHAPAVPAALVPTPEVTPVAIPPQAALPMAIEENELLFARNTASEKNKVFDLETVKQPALKSMSMVVRTGIHEAVMVARRGGRSKAQTGTQQQILPVPAALALLSARPQSTPRLSRRRAWLTAAITLLVLALSISGIALFFNVANSHQNTPQAQIQAGATTPSSAPTSSAGQSSPAATATANQPAATPTTTATPRKKPTPTPDPNPTATPTPTAMPTPTPTPITLQCKVIYTLSDQWPGGFLASLTITNTGTIVIQNWKLVFTFPGQQQILHSWNGNFTQNGAQVSLTGAHFNGNLQPGASANPGFQAIFHGQNNKPASFAVNGVTCA